MSPGPILTETSPPTRAKVAHVAAIDGTLRYLLLNQLRWLAGAGYEVCAISSPGPEVPAIEAAGIRHIAVPMTRRALTPWADLRALWRLWKTFRRERFTIVHTHTPKAGLLGRLAARLAGVPVIVHTSHGFIFHERSHPLWRRLFVAMERLGAACCDLVLSVNREDIGTAVQAGICAEGKIMLLGDGGIGLDLASFDPDRVSPDERRKKRLELGLPEGAPIVGFVGRLVREKGVPELLAAARMVTERLPEARFLIVGSPDTDKPDAVGPSLAHEYGVSHACVFAGKRQDMPEMYSLMDVLVLPSHREGFPRAPMEALAMGVPCIATDVRGCREVVEHGRNGLLVPPGDVQALAAAIIELLTNGHRAGEMGAEGRHVALKRFDERLVFQRVEQEYTRLLREKARQCKEQASRVAYPGKRLLDLAVAVPALVLLSPLMALIALVVRLLMGSPVLFRQQRPGLHGAPFTLFKFRTMTNARDEQGRLLSDAERLTGFGRFLRASSLDELPELINVVKGEMSLVGPRPLLMEYLDRYTTQQMRRHEVRPGITGWAQVNGRNALTWEDKLALDVWYVDHQTLALDLRILCLTVWKLLKREGITHPGYATAPKFMGQASGAESERGGEPR